jgi:tRNA (cytidine56-2'-O)-methyltransferase
MESSTLLFKTHLNNEAEKMPKVVVLRWGHRYRDERVTTHVALTARALGASGMILADVLDEEIKKTVEEVVESWGGSFFFKMGLPWKQVVKEWKEKKSIVVHLTAYGENVQTSDVMQRIRASRKDALVLVGSQKVPPAFFSKAVSDFNVAIGNQPHSECSSLAVFLDHFFEGEELSKEFEGAKMKIIPQKSGKKVLKT